MTFRTIETHTFEDGRSISVGRDRTGWRVAFDGPGNLEVSAPFNRVEIDARTVSLVARTARSGHVETATFEGTPAEYGAVGSFWASVCDDPGAVVERVGGGERGG